MSQKSAKTYNSSDVAKVKNVLAQLPDVTHERQRKQDVLASLKDDILLLTTEKGYTLDEVLDKLHAAGMEDVTIRDLKTLSEGKKPKRQRAPSRNKNADGQTSAPGQGQ
ncbi:molybdopterin-guanine dinucleotide biosynthesis protein MobC [Enterobacter hormaechei]|uniref:molybdopterin-guanine dinucleotide biosynthesis protein MobC n=1 Tax=Enterobacter hormaechei TaxID=158836 RepID=UPI000CEC630A|nr:molybdopterin-guanine dinucleotide biosynthesis protein MobC [Enterobacter hormaechei]ROC77491.1 molybdopterin-guanine dinucleotide biosynthesis protein MobC [Enterobacter hormaechei subsp. steigerwaltii]